MKPVRDVVAAIGRTPLIKLRAASEATGCTILGKAEFMNPGGSVKDRAAMAIINDAVAHGALQPGGVVVEGTAGNTGIGIAMVASALGYRAVIVIPDTQAQEKKDMLRLAGAELVEVPAVPYSNPNNYVRYSGRLAEALAKSEPNGAVWANQFDNVANRRGHYETTGPEIFDDLDGRLDGFVSAVGTGGTLAGVGMALKERNPAIKIALADPPGAALYSYYTTGELKSSGSSVTEGIGQNRITANLEDAAGRFRLPNPRRGGAADHLRSRGAGRSPPRRFVWRQHRRRDPPRPRAWPRPHDRDAALRFGRALRVQALQSRLPAFEEPARSGLARSKRASAQGVRSMTEALFREDAYRTETEAVVLASEPRGIALDRTVFYPQGGGQSGDKGALMLEDGTAIPIANTTYDTDRTTILHVPAEGAALPRPGARVIARIDWALRHQAHARPHRASSAFGRSALSGDGRVGRRRARGGSISTRARPCSTRPRSSAGSTS